MGYWSPLTFARRSTKETSSPFLIWLVFAFWQKVLLKNFSDWTSGALFSWGDESISDNYLWKKFCLTYSLTFFKTVNIEQVITNRLYLTFCLPWPNVCFKPWNYLCFWTRYHILTTKTSNIYFWVRSYP